MMENGKVESCAFSPPSSPPAPFPLPQGAATQTTQPTGPQGSACPADAIRGPFGEIGQRPLLAAQAALGLARPVVSVLRAAPVCPLTEACLCPALDGLAPGSPAAPVGLHLDPAPDLQGPHPLPPMGLGGCSRVRAPPPGGDQWEVSLGLGRPRSAFCPGIPRETLTCLGFIAGESQRKAGVGAGSVGAFQPKRVCSLPFARTTAGWVPSTPSQMLILLVTFLRGDWLLTPGLNDSSNRNASSKQDRLQFSWSKIPWPRASAPPWP